MQYIILKSNPFHFLVAFKAFNVLKIKIGKQDKVSQTILASEFVCHLQAGQNLKFNLTYFLIPLWLGTSTMLVSYSPLNCISKKSWTMLAGWVHSRTYVLKMGSDNLSNILTWTVLFHLGLYHVKKTTQYLLCVYDRTSVLILKKIKIN